jgi:hypothetical protein
VVAIPDELEYHGRGPLLSARRVDLNLLWRRADQILQASITARPPRPAGRRARDAWLPAAASRAAAVPTGAPRVCGRLPAGGRVERVPVQTHVFVYGDLCWVEPGVHLQRVRRPALLTYGPCSCVWSECIWHFCPRLCHVRPNGIVHLYRQRLCSPAPALTYSRRQGV